MAKSKKKSSPTTEDIVVHGARMHNLKNIHVNFPRNKMIVVTGVSGSGKSSLTMDTLFAEGQRRYAESLSSYARQFLMRMDKPDVDYIEGIAPAIAIEQKVTTRTPRSTVGSMTEIQDYLRLLFARIGKTYSPISGELVKKDEVSDVVNFIQSLPEGDRVMILVPLTLHAGRSIKEEVVILLQKGFTRLYLQESQAYSASNIIRMEDIMDDSNGDKILKTIYQAHKKNKVYLLIDRISINKEWEEDEVHRVADSVQTAYYESDGQCSILHLSDDQTEINTFNNKFEKDGIIFEEPSPNFFSFNTPYGACTTCEGFGQILGIDKELVYPFKHLSIYEDAILPWRGDKMSEWKKAFIKEEGKKGFPIHKPLKDLSTNEWKIIDAWVDDFFRMVEQNLYKIQYRVMQARYRGKTKCPSCNGSRLRQDALYVKVDNQDIASLSNLPIADLKAWFDTITISEHDTAIAHRVLLEIQQRIQTLLDVGLGYLTLNRLANTLSGGESQRIQLTKFLGSNLTDSLYILDEPSIGLHPRDTDRLIKVLKHLRDLNNTVIIVEHDDKVMQSADHIIDMGPLAAHLGGEVIAAGNYNDIITDPNSLTGKYLSGALKIELNRSRTFNIKKANTIHLEGCSAHNLKNIDVVFPMNALTVVTGVSGSGKTTLVKKTLYPALMQHLGLSAERPGSFKALHGDIDKITFVEMIDQNPIGKSSRSNPVTYIKAYDDIRNLFANQKSAKLNGLQAKNFSFNVDGGRCDTCKGEGEIIVSMQFLADVHLVCDACKGQKFKEEVLDITYQGKNINQILELGVDEAIEFFADNKNIREKLQTLSSVGLGYIKLGQSSDTLSGGEAQRVKLASYLGKSNAKEKILFIFDEPTTGLHFHDINKLLQSFDALIDKGHSIIVIEHNMDVVRHADWIIDIGPEGGDAGGQLVYAGPVDGITKVKESYTAAYL